MAASRSGVQRSRLGIGYSYLDGVQDERNRLQGGVSLICRDISVFLRGAAIKFFEDSGEMSR